MERKVYSVEEAQVIGDALSVDWGVISLSEFHLGLNIELEQHREKHPTDKQLGEKVLANINDFPLYYSEYN